MKVVKKIALIIAVIFLSIFVCGVIGRGITGMWNPTEWKPSDEASVSGSDGKKDPEIPVESDPPAVTVNPDIISLAFECFPIGSGFQCERASDVIIENRLGTGGAIEIRNGASCVFCSDAGQAGHLKCNGKMFYRGTLFEALKMETPTLIIFETSVPVDLYLWLDNVGFGSVSGLFIRIDGGRVEVPRVPDDDYGCALTVRLSAGEHVIQTDSYCVLPYLSFTPVLSESETPYEPVAHNVISGFTELRFMDVIYESGILYLPQVDGFTVTSDILYGRAYAGSGYFGLKMETSTLIRFETSVSMYLNVRLEDIEPSGYCPYIRVDGKREYGDKVAGDDTGYEVKVTLPAGEHIIQKGSYCVLSYLSLTPV